MIEDQPVIVVRVALSTSISHCINYHRSPSAGSGWKRDKGFLLEEVARSGPSAWKSFFMTKEGFPLRTVKKREKNEGDLHNMEISATKGSGKNRNNRIQMCLTEGQSPI